jgi:hypothetical protein
MIAPYLSKQDTATRAPGSVAGGLVSTASGGSTDEVGVTERDWPDLQHQ